MRECDICEKERPLIMVMMDIGHKWLCWNCYREVTWVKEHLEGEHHA